MSTSEVLMVLAIGVIIGSNAYWIWLLTRYRKFIMEHLIWHRVEDVLPEKVEENGKTKMRAVATYSALTTDMIIGYYSTEEKKWYSEHGDIIKNVTHWQSIKKP